MSSKPIVYSWDDVGSPGRNLTGNKQNRIKQILKACLVDGYGDKPAAGWEMVHEHPNGFSMTNGFGVVNIVSDVEVFGGSVGMDFISLFLAEGITDTSGAILKATNLVSGGNTNSSHHKVPLENSMITNLSYLRWSLYADAKTAILVFFSRYVNTGGVLYIGEFNSYLGKDNFVALGGTFGSSNFSDFASLHTSVTSLRDLETGLITNKFVDFYGMPHGLDRNKDATNYLSSNIIGSDFFEFTRIPVALNGVGIVGTLRGLLFSPQLYRSFHVLPRSFTIDGLVFADYAALPLDFGTGDLIATTFSWMGNVSVTDNEDYW